MRIRLSDARLEDEGGYFCQLYTEDTHHQIATLTVLGNPPPRVPLSFIFCLRSGCFLTSWTSGFTGPLVSTLDPCHLWDLGSLWSLGSSSQTDLTWMPPLTRPSPRASFLYSGSGESCGGGPRASSGGRRGGTQLPGSAVAPRSGPALVSRSQGAERYPGVGLGAGTLRKEAWPVVGGAWIIVH